MHESPVVLASVEELLEGAGPRTPLDTVGKSGARLERVDIGGASYVVKYLDEAGDWTLRAAAVPETPPVALWRNGVLAALPGCINQPIVAVARGSSTGTNGAVLLMHDVSAWLVPVDAAVPEAQHDGFLRHMAAMHARFWESPPGREPIIDLVPAERYYRWLSPAMAAREAELGSEHLVPKLVAEGWARLVEVAPRAAEVVLPLADDPRPLVRALARTPQTFVHGDWKFDNLGSDEEGRTILLDCELPGRGAPLSDLAWYLAINCRRLPITKEASLDRYRAALEAEGIGTADWWEEQVALCLLGALVQFGWEKALDGYDEELAWWEERAVAAAPLTR